jgi:hypothetical protein
LEPIVHPTEEVAVPTKTTDSKRKPRTTRKAGPREPAALKRLNSSLDTAEAAVVALRKDLSKDVSSGARDLYADLERFVKAARRDGSKLGRALERDMRKAERKLARSRS